MRAVQLRRSQRRSVIGWPGNSGARLHGAAPRRAAAGPGAGVGNAGRSVQLGLVRAELSYDPRRIMF